MNQQPDITQLLLDLNSAAGGGLDRLMPLVYEQLKAIAINQMKKERPDHTLSPTALVHEAYLKLVDQTRVNWQNRAQFFAISAQAMRRILINHAQKKLAQKRGGDLAKVTLDEQASDSFNSNAEELIALDQALEKLATLDERQSRIVELRYFGGLTNPEVAEVLRISEATVQRSWTVARAWLHRELTAGN